MQDLQPFHSFHLPVKAKQIIEIHSIPQLIQEWQAAQRHQLPVLFLGQGSNVLFLQDFQGVVLINRLLGIEQYEDENFHYLKVNAGENWHHLVEWSLQQGIYGLENLALIPGCAGSAPVQNIGAYGLEFKDVCDYVEVLDLQNGNGFRLTQSECEFGYRESVFKHRYAEHYLITAIGLKLAKQWQPILKYGSLVNFDPNHITAQQIFTEICQIRRSKLPDPDEFGNAGSFFKNPVVSAEQFATIAKRFPNVPHFPQIDGKVKLAAGWLIDQCGLKGYQIGGAMVHQQQALVLINTGNATGQDVLKLARYVRNQVQQKFNVCLEPEVRFIDQYAEINAVQALNDQN